MGALLDLIGDVVLGAVTNVIHERWGWIGLAVILVTAMGSVPNVRKPPESDILTAK
jgi:hypothetical protein